jgi:Xaa-Pro aminopeptidase
MLSSAMSARRSLADLDRDLAEMGCAALLVLASSSRDPDLAPFVGPVHLGGAFLVAPRGTGPFLGFLTPMEREEAAATGLALLEPAALEVGKRLEEGLPAPDFLAAVVARGLELAGVAPGRLALAGHGAAGVLWGAGFRLASRGFQLVAGNELTLLLRKTKSPPELAAARAAAAGTGEALRAVARLLAAAEARAGAGPELWLEGERLKVGRLRAEVARTLAASGLEQPEGNILAPGRDAAVPHSTGDDGRVLRSGEALVADLFPRGALFADCTRTFCVGRPPEPLQRAHGTVLEALAGAHREAAAGARGFALQESACARLGAAGYPTLLSHPGTEAGYVHGLGHGVGHELHEYPSFRKHAGREGVLARGDLFTLEPGLYDPEAGWGVRLEDLVALGDHGPENLTPLPYDLDPRVW